MLAENLSPSMPKSYMEYKKQQDRLLTLSLQTIPKLNTHSQNLICEKLQDFASTRQARTKFEPRELSLTELIGIDRETLDFASFFKTTSMIRKPK